ncbi:MAG: 4'-phosphopantetheinyl transferase superfamily protein, partial [Ginsengibacter sp.]
GIWHIKEHEQFFLEKVPLHQNITHTHKRLQHMAGRLLLKVLYPDFPLPLILIADTNKPFLENEVFHFSISHCGDYAAVIISTISRVGVDIELATQKIERIKYKFLNDSELAMHSAVGKKLLTLFWSVKEAVYKWYGGGEVDFRKHINIVQDNIDPDAGTILCEFLKDGHVYLNISYTFFGDMCLAWLVTKT